MRTGTAPAEKCFPSLCITARVCSGGSPKKESMPAIVVSSKAFLLAGATVVTASPDHAGLRSGCSAESALPGSHPGARHFVIGPSSFVRHVPSGAVSYANCRFDRSDETYRNSFISSRVGLNCSDPPLYAALILRPANLDRASIGVIGCRRPLARTAAHCALRPRVHWR
jgi:hypothetical protein